MLYNFSFIIPKLLAGMACPGTFSPLEEDLQELKENGIESIVSLTEYPLSTQAIQKAGINYLHLPIPDFTPPTLSQINTFTDFVSRQHKEKKGVVVHCAAGIGRTGTMLACYLVYCGESSDNAIESIRTLRRGSIETLEQENIIHHYYKESTKHG